MICSIVDRWFHCSQYRQISISWFLLNAQCACCSRLLLQPIVFEHQRLVYTTMMEYTSYILVRLGIIKNEVNILCFPIQASSPCSRKSTTQESDGNRNVTRDVGIANVPIFDRQMPCLLQSIWRPSKMRVTNSKNTHHNSIGKLKKVTGDV
jgi:hypothetical protein